MKRKIDTLLTIIKVEDETEKKTREASSETTTNKKGENNCQ